MRIVACCALLLASSAASATVLWRGDYESGDISQWDGYEGILSRLTVMQSPTRQGKYALRVELHQGDIAFSGTRNEVSQEGKPEVEGNDRWFAWSTLFPSDFPASTSWQVFTQWHHSGCCGSPPIEFDLEGERIQFAHHGDQVLWSTPLVRGVWHDFVVHVYFSSTAGFVELWYNGQKVLEKTSVATVNPGEYVYLKQGLYRDASIAPVAVVYHDGMVEGTSLADVAPQLVPAPPVDGGTPPDAGTPPVADAGTPPVADAGTPSVPDAGPVGGPVDDVPAPAPTAPVTTSTLSGTGCSSGALGALAVLGLLALLMPARRRVRVRSRR
jgi:hypothetical protein